MKINELVNDYNKFIESKTKTGENMMGNMMKWYYAPLLRLGDSTNDDEIEEVKKYFPFQLSDELLEFYRKYSFLSYDKEQELLTEHKVRIFSPKFIINKINKDNGECNSLGLIDMIKFSWENERPEFDEISYDDIKKINDKYKSIGWYGKSGENDTYFIYVDESSKFGVVYYHQDDFDTLKETLFRMIDKSSADMTFNEVIGYMLLDLKENIEVESVEWLSE